MTAWIILQATVGWFLALRGLYLMQAPDRCQTIGKRCGFGPGKVKENAGHGSGCIAVARCFCLGQWQPKSGVSRERKKINKYDFFVV